jgi:hypothetical protein
MLSCSPCHIFCSVITIHTHVILFTVLLLVNGTVKNNGLLSLWLMDLSWICSARYHKLCCSCPPTQKKLQFFWTHVLITIFTRFLLGRGVAVTVTGLSPLRPKVTPVPVIVGCGEQICTVTVLSPSSSVFPGHCHSTNAPYSFFHLSLIWHYLRNWHCC